MYPLKVSGHLQFKIILEFQDKTSIMKSHVEKKITTENILPQCPIENVHTGGEITTLKMHQKPLQNVMH